MKVSLNWLKEYTDIVKTPEEYAHRMVMTGTGVEGLERPGDDIENVVVGRIESMQPHGNSDHMQVCQVEVGGRIAQIVTGAPNVQPGQLVPVALDGAKLPGGKTIHASPLRGVMSEGMLCSGPELGVTDELYPSVGEAGILVFQEDYAPGTDVRPLLGLDDTIVDFEILANRPDCQCVWGVARESAVALGTVFRKPEITVDAVPGEVSDFVSIDVQDDALCPRYTARVVKNVRIGPSPRWMQRALHAAGMRAINNVVDITNYVMLETGHPMHAFDLGMVAGSKIIVRRARPGETLRTLDGKDRETTPEMLMICDADKATGFGGIMGGEESEITGKTGNVLFECAAFDRTSIRLTSRALGLRTESSGRFEKGVSPATTREAIDRACQLINMLDAGDVIEGVYDHFPHPEPRKEIEASVSRIVSRLGVDIPGERMAEILRALHFEVTLTGDTLRATVPLFRQDVDQEADLSEEVLRIYGFEHIRTTMLRGETTQGGRSQNMRFADRVKAVMTARGLSETISFSFISPRDMEKLGLMTGDPRQQALALQNPLGEDTSVMRPSLAPSMLKMMALNQHRGNPAAGLFELAPVFDIAARRAGELPTERRTLVIGMYADFADFFTLRGILQELLAQFGLSMHVRVGGEVYHHTGRSATLLAEDQVAATLGEVHPDVADAFELSRRTLLAEVDLEVLYGLYQPMGQAKPLPRYPAITRDLALVMNEQVPVGSVMEEIQGIGGQRLERVEVFDVYRGAQAGAGKKSVAFSLVFRDAERTLTDADIAPVMEGILHMVAAKFSAAIRG